VRKQRQSYSGSVEIWVDGVKRFDVAANLTGWIDPSDDAVSWDGRFEGLSHHNRLELIGHPLELRLSNDNSGMAIMTDSSGVLRGQGPVPF
jgi:hypothetical protein